MLATTDPRALSLLKYKHGSPKQEMLFSKDSRELGGCWDAYEGKCRPSSKDSENIYYSQEAWVQSRNGLLYGKPCSHQIIAGSYSDSWEVEALSAATAVTVTGKAMGSQEEHLPRCTVSAMDPCLLAMWFT